MTPISNEEILRAVNSTRDSLTVQIAGLRAALTTATEEIQAQSVRINELEIQSVKEPQTIAISMPPPSELKELVEDMKNERAMKKARSLMQLESASAEAAEIVKKDRRKAFIAWFLGTLVVVAQLITIVRGLNR